MPKKISATKNKNNELATKADVFDIVQNSTDPLKADLKMVRSDLQSSIDRVYTDMNKGFESIRTEIRENNKELMDIMVQSFHFVYARFDKIDERFTTLESGMNVRFNSVNTRLDNAILDTPRWADHEKLAKRVTVLEKQR